MENSRKLVVNRTAINHDEPLVMVENVVKTYKHKNAVNGVSLTINAGDRIGIIGANGSGKSTLSEIIGGIRHATSGTVKKQDNLVIGLQFQESRYPLGISVMDMLKYYLHTFSIPMTQSELDQLLITYQIVGFENKFIQSLSGGQQQRLNILLSVIHKPDLVILDEVSTGLDIEVRSQIFDFLQKNVVETKTAMVLVSHEFNEIEALCEKFYYMHNGEIKDAGLIKDIVKQHGSVYNYASMMLHKFKDAERAAEIAKAESELKKTDKTKIVSTSRNYGKNLPLILLILKYYYKGFFVPFFLVVYPILILFLQGFAFKTLGKADLDHPEWYLVHSLVGSIGLVQLMSVGIFVIPQTILEFKNSVLMKRIGATDIKPILFVLAVITIGLVFIVLCFLWTLLWGGIFFGSTYGWRNIALPQSIGPAIPFLLLIFAVTLTFGMMLSSLFSSATSFIAISNVIYLPISFLSGGFAPMSLILGNDILKIATYFNPFKYSIDPFLSAWNGHFVFENIYFAYLAVTAALILGFSGIAAWKLRWQA